MNDYRRDWTMEKLYEYLRSQDVDPRVDLIERLKGEGITWEQFSRLNQKKLDDLGITSVQEKRVYLKYLENYRKDLELAGSKVVQDSIHGPIELHPLLVKIIDTPQFQRLRDIKQLGGVYYVFPGASHNRFEHCIGVCYLAGEFMDSLVQHQPELDIDDSDVLCIKIAALCHDMGHGPFSHLYQDLFIPEYHKERKWKHEEASMQLMKYMVENEGLEDEFLKYGLDWKEEKIFIEELITGEPIDGQDDFKGRDKSKHFLYEIVANKVNGIDVDKMDYLLRDSHGLGIQIHFDWKRYISFARVIRKPVSDVQKTGTGRSASICVRKKMTRDVYELFHVRDRLFRAAYQHKTKRAVEFMFLDVLKIANEIVFLPGKNGTPVKISDAIDDMEAFTKLTDSIFHIIAVSFDPKLEEAQKLLQAIHQRKFYMFIGQRFSNENNDSRAGMAPTSPIDQWGKAIIDIIPKGKKTSLQLNEEFIKVEVITFNHGLGNNHPLDKVVFYEKERPDEMRRMKTKDMSSFFPKHCIENQYRVYYMKNFPEAIEVLKVGFEKYCETCCSAMKKQERSLDEESSSSSPELDLHAGSISPSDQF